MKKELFYFKNFSDHLHGQDIRLTLYVYSTNFQANKIAVINYIGRKCYFYLPVHKFVNLISSVRIIQINIFLYCFCGVKGAYPSAQEVLQTPDCSLNAPLHEVQLSLDTHPEQPFKHRTQRPASE